MGTEIKDIIDLTITRETARVLQAGFGIPMIMGPTFRIPDRIKAYGEPADLLSDGFSTSDNIYIAALKMFSQELSPEQFYVGNKKENVNSLQTITFDALATAGTFTVTVGAATTAAIAYNANAAAIKAAIELLAGVTEVTVAGDMPVLVLTVEFTGVDGNQHWAAITVDVSALTGVTSETIVQTQYGSAEDASWTDAINAIIAANPLWYAMMATTRTQSEILELAAVIESEDKLYFTCTDDADVLTGVSTDTASKLQALSYDRTIFLWSADEANYPEGAWMGGNLPKEPGSLTWKFKPLVGITADELGANDLVNLKAKNANFYETVAGNSIITSEAVVVSGEYIDIMRGTDWIHARIGEDEFLVFLNNDKIPYTNKGVSLLTNPLRARLIDAASEARRILVEESIVVNEPDVDAALQADKAARLLKGITFSATYQGAVHKVEINGKLSF